MVFEGWEEVEVGWPNAGWPKAEEGVVVSALANTDGAEVFVLPNAEGAAAVVLPNADSEGAPNTDPKADLTGAPPPNVEVVAVEAFPNAEGVLELPKAEGVQVLPNAELEEEAAAFDPWAPLLLIRLMVVRSGVLRARR